MKLTRLFDMKTRRNKYPLNACVDSIYKTIKPFGGLPAEVTFYIYSFGGYYGRQVWFCKTMFDNGKNFKVYKKTMQEAIDNGTLQDLGFTKKLIK